jgi:Uma2 family endonuclease
MSIVQRMDPATYERLAVSSEYKLTELWDGIPVEKPIVSDAHGDTMVNIAVAIAPQLDRDVARLRINHAKLAIPGGNYFIPDVAVLPASAGRDPAAADLWHVPAFLVVENWSPSTGGYDARVKIPAYMARGDAEIWRVHPLERTVRRWVRQPDGRYAETLVEGGRIALAALPGVEVELAAIFRS